MKYPEFSNLALLTELAIAYERSLHYVDDALQFAVWEQRYNELIKIALMRMKD